MSTRTQTNTCVSSSPQPESDPCFLTAQDQRADRQRHAQSRGLIDSQGQPLGTLPPPTRPRRQMAGSIDTSGYPGLPPGDNPQDEDNDSDHRNQSPHPSRNNFPRKSTGDSGGGPPDDGDDDNNGDVEPPIDPPPDGNDSSNIADDVRCELRSLQSGGQDSSSKVRASDPFDGSDPNKLKKVRYALTFLKGAALEFFEPYILAEDDPGYVEPTFFTDWIAVKQILLDNFGSTFPEEEAEMALEKLAFPDGGRATKYFIQFAKYKAHINFGNHAYRCITYHALPKRLKDCITNITPRPDSYEDLRHLVLQLDACYWEYKSEEKTEARVPSKTNTSTWGNNNSGNTGGSSGNNKPTSNKGKTKQKSTLTNDIGSKLEPDSKLLPAECQ
ncbi:hypothetical protein M422DRAFT_265930 [Sphaerobolus stellatus SS14]|uniref:Retrotransposon gag domain-containing protein n=1 Tax=Sphaerobolus stellatus (strain SS14) TaxID=990650 RepID=A0A0C9V4A6_SPHS4|nr:hypothetical protein M422DRAFT_265930 [Sphaerobolus stellatus SS14]